MELFWQHGSCTLELVSSRFRRQRQGPWTRAGGRKKQGLKVVSSSESNVWHYCFAVSEAPATTSLWSCFGAWELHFGAGFLSVQKATTGSLDPS